MYRDVIVPDFQDRAGRWLRVCNHRGVRAVTWSGGKYASMLSRCGNPRFPSYLGVTVAFNGFPDFVDWHRQQIGYGLPEMHLDKDILVKGAKTYSRETCCLVPKAVNQLFATNGARRGEYPLGVSWSSEKMLFVAQLNIDGRRKALGRYPTVDAAFTAYRQAKEEQIRAVARRYQHDLDPRVFEALMNYKVEMAD